MAPKQGTIRRAVGVAALVGAMVVGAALPGGPAGAVASPPAPATAAAAAGAEWLTAQIGPAGYVPSAADASSPSWVDTREAALALAAAGGHAAEVERAVAYLAGHLAESAAAGDLTDSTGADQPGRVAQLVLLALATGRDPRAFGGTGPSHDLVARLLATERTTGPDAGLFGTQLPLYDGAYRQGLALSALAAVGVAAPRARSWLAAQQCDDGSWMAYRADLGAPCAFDPETFTGPDTNSTALAAIGLSATCAEPRRDVVAYAEAAQGAGLGWSFGGNAAEAADPNSTALMISALLALGHEPTEARFSGEGTPLDALVAFQFTEGPDAGAFWYPPFGEGPRTANLLATAQAVTALSYRASVVAPATPCTTTTSTTTTTAPSTTTTTTSTTTTAPSTTTTTTTTPASVAGRTATREATPASAVAASPRFAG